MSPKKSAEEPDRGSARVYEDERYGTSRVHLYFEGRLHTSRSCSRRGDADALAVRANVVLPLLRSGLTEKPEGVGKTFIAHALGHVAGLRTSSILAIRADRTLKTLKHARLDNSYEVELRRLISVDLLIVDDFGLDALDAVESRDAHEIFVERHRAGSMIVTSNRGPDGWLATFATRSERKARPTGSRATRSTS